VAKKLIVHGGGGGRGESAQKRYSDIYKYSINIEVLVGWENLRCQSRGESADRHDESRDDALRCTCHAIEELRASHMMGEYMTHACHMRRRIHACHDDALRCTCHAIEDLRASKDTE